jgi:hydrogenase nickel incorporation protein HypA/HybF
MHELGLLERLVEMVQDEARRNNVTQVHRLRLKVGVMSGVVPDALRFAFDAVTPGTILAGATLEIEELPVVCRCRDCETVFQPEAPVYVCPQCESLHAELLQGEELTLESMEASE